MPLSSPPSVSNSPATFYSRLFSAAAVLVNEFDFLHMSLVRFHERGR
jgi:hypothetical protein